MSDVNPALAPMSDDDFFDLLSKETPAESGGMVDLPANAWLVMRTTVPNDGSEKVLPRVEFFDTKEKTDEKTGVTSPSRTLYQFRTGLVCQGGDSLVNAKQHKNKFLFFDAFVHPGEREQGQTLSGRLVGFLNCLFASGVAEEERLSKDKEVAVAAANRRWSTTVGFLRTVAQQTGISRADYDGDAARWLTGLAVKALEGKPRQIIVKTGMLKQRNQDERKLGISSFESATPEGIAKHKIEFFDGAEAATGAATTSSPMSF